MNVFVLSENKRTQLEGNSEREGFYRKQRTEENAALGDCCGFVLNACCN